LTDRRPSSRYAVALDGELLRYEYAFSGTKTVEYHSQIAEYKDPIYFDGERIIIRQLISRQFRIQAISTREQFVVNQSHQIFVTPDRDSAKTTFVLAQLNSRLLSFVHVNSSALALRDDFPKLVLEDTKHLPVLDLAVKDPLSRDVTVLLGTIRESYYAAGEEHPFARLCACLGQESKRGVERPVVAGAVCALAEELVGERRNERTEKTDFLQGLCQRLKPGASNLTVAVLDTLKSKTTLLEYAGDYERNEESIGFDDFAFALQRNAAMFENSVTRQSSLSQIKAEFEKSVKRIEASRTRARTCDKLIDLLICWLFGLTINEVVLVEQKR
jgi:hypothetical protein